MLWPCGDSVYLPAFFRVMNFVNIHLFHDEDNFISLDKVSRWRWKNSNMMLDVYIGNLF